jgi:hypothetical protein
VFLESLLIDNSVNEYDGNVPLWRAATSTELFRGRERVSDRNGRYCLKLAAVFHHKCQTTNSLLMCFRYVSSILLKAISRIVFTMWRLNIRSIFTIRKAIGRMKELHSKAFVRKSEVCRIMDRVRWNFYTAESHPAGTTYYLNITYLYAKINPLPLRKVSKFF